MTVFGTWYTKHLSDMLVVGLRSGQELWTHKSELARTQWLLELELARNPVRINRTQPCGLLYIPIYSRATLNKPINHINIRPNLHIFSNLGRSTGTMLTSE